VRLVDDPVRREGAAPPAPSRRRARRFAIVGATALTLALAAVFGKGGMFDAMRYRQERDRLQAEIAQRQDENARLERELRSLRHDDLEIERIAREELVLAKPGEVVILLPPERSGGE
jgi:cell division protein FtsB